MSESGLQTISGELPGWGRGRGNRMAALKDIFQRFSMAFCARGCLAKTKVIGFTEG